MRTHSPVSNKSLTKQLTCITRMASRYRRQRREAISQTRCWELPNKTRYLTANYLVEQKQRSQDGNASLMLPRLQCNIPRQPSPPVPEKADDADHQNHASSRFGDEESVAERGETENSIWTKVSDELEFSIQIQHVAYGSPLNRKPYKIEVKKSSAA